MRALLDVNVIIALLDPDHVFHDKAHKWWASHSSSGWASCPIVENGTVRIMSNIGYTRGARFTPGDLIVRLRAFAEQTNHEFWSDDISLRDGSVFALDRIHGSKQLTDIYLLAIAAKHKGRLVTFDEGIAVSVVREARPANLLVI